jgi:hypothetical protein
VITAEIPINPQSLRKSRLEGNRITNEMLGGKDIELRVSSEIFYIEKTSANSTMYD